MGSIIIYPDDSEPVQIECCNGFVSRVVAPVAYESVADARVLAAHLNQFFANGGALQTDGAHAKLIPHADAAQ